MLLHMQSREILLTRACVPALPRARALNIFAFFPTCTEKLVAHANYTSPYSVRFLENVCVNFL